MHLHVARSQMKTRVRRDFLLSATLASPVLNRWTVKSPDPFPLVSSETHHIRLHLEPTTFVFYRDGANNEQNEREIGPQPTLVVAVASYTEAHFHVGGGGGREEDGGDGVVNPRNRELERDSLGGLAINEGEEGSVPHLSYVLCVSHTNRGPALTPN